MKGFDIWGVRFLYPKKDKDKDKKLICANCRLEFKTIDELADHAEKRHPYR